jgi:hypothetical protein
MPSTSQDFTHSNWRKENESDPIVHLRLIGNAPDARHSAQRLFRRLRRIGLLTRLFSRSGKSH